MRRIFTGLKGAHHGTLRICARDPRSDEPHGGAVRPALCPQEGAPSAGPGRVREVLGVGRATGRPDAPASLEELGLVRRAPMRGRPTAKIRRTRRRELGGKISRCACRRFTRGRRPIVAIKQRPMGPNITEDRWCDERPACAAAAASLHAMLGERRDKFPRPRGLRLSVRPRRPHRIVRLLRLRQTPGRMLVRRRFPVLSAPARVRQQAVQAGRTRGEAEGLGPVASEGRRHEAGPR